MSLKTIPLTALIAVLTQVVPAQQSTLENFFSDFSADWVRHDPSLATATRYFTGDEQNRLERQNHAANVSVETGSHSAGEARPRRTE